MPSSKTDSIRRHQHMVEDPIRATILAQAVQAIVKPGMTVLDLGCGTGVLTLAALKAGASKVYACDVDEAIDVAMSEVKKRGWSKRVHFFKGLSSEFPTVEKVDVILSETIGSLGLEENILLFVLDARERWLKKDGVILPESTSIYVCPMEGAPVIKSTGKNQGVNEVNFTIGDVGEKQLLGESQAIHKVRFLNNKQVGIDKETTLSITRSGTLDAVAGWMETIWAPGLSTRTSPTDTQTHWKQAILPLSCKIKVKPGDKLRFRLRVFPQDEATQSAIEWGYEMC